MKWMPGWSILGSFSHVCPSHLGGARGEGGVGVCSACVTTFRAADSKLVQHIATIPSTHTHTHTHTHTTVVTSLLNNAMPFYLFINI